MAKKKKGNMRNIQPGATLQFLNYLTPDHILRGKYNIGNNELDITDVPANLNSVITLGQGGGSSDFTFAEVTFTNTKSGMNVLLLSNLAVIDSESNYISQGISAFGNNTKKWQVILYQGRAIGSLDSGTITSTTGAIEYDGDEGAYIITGDCTITGEGA